MGYKARIWLVSAAVGLTVILYFMPRKADNNSIPGVESPGKNEGNVNTFNIEKFIENSKKEYRSSQLTLVNALEARANQTSQPSTDLLDSLAKAWDELKQPGISASYFEKKALFDNSEKSYIEASYRYFDAFKATDDTVSKAGWVEKAISSYKKVLELNPGNLDAKTDLGLCYTEGSQEPMKGILLLREVVKENPNHENAQLNLGFLSVKSGQYDKAMERFDNVLKINPKKFEVYIYKGETSLQMGNKKKALEYFNAFLKESSDEKMKIQVEAYINEIKIKQ